MHDGDRLGQAATGKLIRPKNKRAANPFPSGVALMNLATKVATHFRYGTHIDNLHNIFEITDSPIIKPKVDKNSTCVVAHHRLM